MFVRYPCRTFKNIHRNLTSQRIFILFFAEFLRGTDWIIKRTMASGGKSFILKYQQGDLFDCPKTDSLVHCVSRDLKMGKGIAVIFKKKFGQVDYLKRQGKKVGEVAFIDKDGRYIYYLITKEKATDKPTYDDLKKSLQHLKKHCVFAKVAHLSMPRIGCGLDRLEWSTVEQILCDTFGDMNITITVYDLPPKEADVKQNDKSHHSRDEKANPKGEEMDFSKAVKALKADQKSPQTEDEKTYIRKDGKPFLKRDEKVPSKDENSSFKSDEKVPSKDENSSFKSDEKAPSKDEKSSFKRDVKATSKGDEKPSS